MTGRNRAGTALILAAAAMVMLVLAPTAAHADLVVEEQFVYEAAMLDTLDGGTGFDGPWVATKSHGRDYYVGLTEFADEKPLNADSGLSFSTLPVAGSALSRYGSAGRAEAHRTISAASQAALTQDNTTIWFSLLFAGPAANRGAMFVFATQPLNHTDLHTMAAPGSGFGFSIHSPSDGPISAVAFNNSANATIESGVQYTPSPLTAVNLIVGKINWKPNGTPDEYFLFNVTDLTTEPAESEAIASITNLDFDQSAFNLVALCDGTNAVTDEIRFGNTFADVTGVVDEASSPDPKDDTMLETTWAPLRWRAGTFAVSHDVYFGDNFDDVNQATPEDGAFMGNQSETRLTVQDLTPGTTYYWRIDEVTDLDPDRPLKGEVWSFRVRPAIAWAPAPADGAKYVLADSTLSWDVGLGALFHTIYFGESFDEVSNATTGGFQFVETSYDPGALELDTTYYWRIDEFTPTGTVKGDVWSFTTVPEIVVTDPNLVGWWKFETGAGDRVLDFSGHGNHGTIVDKVLWAPGQFNLALEFFGDNQGHVELPAGMVSTASGSVALWVNTNQTGDLYSEGTFWYGAETTGTGLMGFGEQEIHVHSQTTGALGFWMGGATSVSLDGPMLAGTGWNHVAVTWDQTEGCTLYCNGVQADIQAHNGKAADLAVIRLGRPNRNFRFLKGFLDDVRLFDRAITAEQVSEIMTRGEDPRKAGAPSPGNGSVATLTVAQTLSWSAGQGASQHDVYFGTDAEAVGTADNSSPEFQGSQPGTSFPLAGLVEFGGGDYYWRIDEVAADGAVQTGYLWKFAVPDYLTVDDFESYTNEVGSRVFEKWIDGAGFTQPVDTPGNGSGALVGHDIWTGGYASLMETGDVYDGRQAMPIYYDNTAAPGYSQADHTLTPPQNWTLEGVTTLVVHIRGEADNTGALYVEINGVKVPYDGDPADIASAGWVAWEIDLASVGVNLTNVTTMTIGIEGGETGVVYVDAIRLTKP
ncbi:MAG: LamG domain-containing protein [Sedimentisphaerales bacterium]|nr:LamG domain-containing protein [Sedimentisphaerales bacterium]